MQRPDQLNDRENHTLFSSACATQTQVLRDSPSSSMTVRRSWRIVFESGKFTAHTEAAGSGNLLYSPQTDAFPRQNVELPSVSVWSSLSSFSAPQEVHSAPKCSACGQQSTCNEPGVCRVTKPTGEVAAGHETRHVVDYTFMSSKF